jgi:formylmethanofuran dehydrogenase subunit A
MIRLKGGHLIDPVNRLDGIGDLWIDGDRVGLPPPGGRASETIDLPGCIVMAGGIDIHSHIAGGNVNTARLLLPEEHKAHVPRPRQTHLSAAGWTAGQTGMRYAEMGFTLVVEPAVLPSHALHAHLELADIPYIDKAGLCVLGNDDFLLSMLRDGESEGAIAAYVAEMVAGTRALGVKVINAGAATAFKKNARSFALDDIVPEYGVSSRRIVEALQTAVGTLGIPHPLHVHCNNLGEPGNFSTAIATMDAANGKPMHFAHLQFYSYGTEGRRGFSSAAAQLAEEINRRPNITVDVGQVMFGQTVTVSCDVLRQFSARDHARPHKYVIWDGEASGGGIVPYRYSASSFHNVVQWAVGLELFLLVKDPWRVFFTTDHPNAAPFTSYPEILALLMSRDLRREWIDALPRSALSVTTLPSIEREYSLSEVAIMTRAAPARLLGMTDRGHLGAGARADIAVYEDRPDRAVMFRRASHVFKDGRHIVKNGACVGSELGRAHRATVDGDRAMARRLSAYYQQSYGLPASMFAVQDHMLGPETVFGEVPCAR